jgi:DNA-binding MarR family transcriptional regulator
MEKSVFDLKQQNQSTDDRIVASFERIAEAFRVLLWEESKKTGLSPIQIQLLIFILFQPGERCTVTYLAREFNMTKATISDAVKVLEQKKLVIRNYSGTDSRSYTLSLSKEGKEVAQATSVFANVIKKQLRGLDDTHKSTLLYALLEIIHQLNQVGVITTQRMCQTCRFFEPGKTKHYCTLVKQPLKHSDLRLDCPEHELEK